MKAALALAASLALVGCVQTQLSPSIIAAIDCTQRIPPSYQIPVPGAPLPALASDVRDLAKFGDDQTKNLDTANTRTSDLIQIANVCQAKQRDVLTDLVPKPWYSPLTAAWTALHGPQATK